MKSTNLKPDYGNWLSSTLIIKVTLVTAGIGALLLMSFIPLVSERNLTAVVIVRCILIIAGLIGFLGILKIYDAWLLFSYDHKRGLAKQIIDFVAENVEWDGSGQLLDIGCGSGALTITCAKKFPQAQVTGIDYWGKDFRYTQIQCESNAKAENVGNACFRHGNAIKLDFPDESFDAVVSNYVYHNIGLVKNKQELLLETLRVLKKGGCFAIHDFVFNQRFYGDINAFAESLIKSGFAKVCIVDTTAGRPLTKKLARRALLIGSGLIYGVK